MTAPPETRDAAISLYRAGGLSLRAVGAAVGVSYMSVRRWDLEERTMPQPKSHDLVLNEGLREAFILSGLSPGEVARRLGWWRTEKGRRVPDGTRVLRVLGVRTVAGKRERGRRYRRVAYWTAERLARAIGVDPVDVGL